MQGGVALLAEGADGVFPHRDYLTGCEHLDRQPVGLVAGQLGAQDIFLAHQQHAHAVFAGGEQRAFNFTLRGVVAPHGVNGDGGHQPLGRSCELLAFNRHRSAAPVVTTTGTSAVGQFGLVAVGALAQLPRGERIVRTSLVLA